MPSAIESEFYDVVVIGGGLSGLSAATQLVKAGKSTVLLEARDRVGGKTWSIDHKDGTLDLGGAWINEFTQPNIYKYAKEFGLETFPQNTDGNCVLQTEDGSVKPFAYGNPWPITAEELLDITEIRDLIEEKAREIDLRNPGALEDAAHWDQLSVRTFAEKYAKTQMTKETLFLWSRIMFGVEPEKMSMLYFIDYMRSGGSLAALRSDRSDGSQALRIKQGTQPIAKGLAAKLGDTVKLNAPVASVSYSSSDAELSTVTTQDGTVYKCKKVICTIPTTLYKDIHWEPPFPEKKSKLVDNTEMGYYSKVTLVYDTPFWKELGFCGLTQSFKGPAVVTRDTSSGPPGRPDLTVHAITCFLVGGPGRKWSSLPPDERKAQVINQVVSMYGHPLAGKPAAVFEQEWIHEPYSQGAPSPVMKPGLLSTLGAQLRAPVGNVHFGGTETAYEWKGYMDGAITSGERVAEEVIAELDGKGL